MSDDVAKRQEEYTLSLVDQGRPVAFSFEDMIGYHGPGSPGGVAHAFKVLERALPLLAPDGPAERREITVRTAFGGPGARDAFELVTRAVTEGRYASIRRSRSRSAGSPRALRLPARPPRPGGDPGPP